MAVEYEPLDVDLRLNSVNSGELTYTIDGNNASGSLTMDNFVGETVTVDFELPCIDE